MPGRLTVTKKATWGILLAAGLTAGATAPATADAAGQASALHKPAASAAGVKAYVSPQLRLLAATRPDAPADVILQLRPAAAQAEVTALLDRLGVEVHRPLALIDGLEATADARVLQAAAASGLFQAITPNGGIQPTGVSVDETKLAAQFAHASKSSQKWKEWTGKGIGVAVVDSGVRGDHKDFRKVGSTTGRVVASVVANPAATSARDTVGHGTHVAGVIAGDTTQRDTKDPLFSKYEGVAPESDIVSIKVDDDAGQADVGDVIAGIQFAVEQRATYNIRVLNLSLNSDVAQPYDVDPLNAAVEAAWFKGIVVVAAAGNRGSAADAVHYAPANDLYVITVGATDDRGTREANDDVLASFSSSGRTQHGVVKPDVTASGSGIVSTLAPGSAFATYCPECVRDGEYLRIGGSSMATAVVSGVVANLLQARPSLTPDQVKGALVNRVGRLGQVDQGASMGAAGSALNANTGLTPNQAIDPATREMKSSSSWTRSSWSTAPDSLTAGWSRSSWSCAECKGTAEGAAEWTRSSWSRSSWSRSSWSGLAGH